MGIGSVKKIGSVQSAACREFHYFLIALATLEFPAVWDLATTRLFFVLFICPDRHPSAVQERTLWIVLDLESCGGGAYA